MDRHAAEERARLMQIRVRTPEAPTPWLPVQRRAGPGADTAPVLVCFAPAGAGAGFFRGWADSLPDLRIVPVQLPGREERFGEALQENAIEMARQIALAIAGEGWSRPHLLGYSFGALLAFETALQLERSGHAVAGVIAMARAAPQSAPQPSVADLPDGDFLDYVRGLGGLPPEFEEMPELAELMLPAIRADFRANDGYARPEEERLACPVVTIAGASDPATSEGRDADWATRSMAKHQLIRVEGGHFFINEGAESVFERIRDVVLSAQNAGRSDKP
ncbi:thioesterase domain-containing protein [Nisaea acidiphila]|uniref:Thioesterase domain-containing protein n=1 Tax=Nisaea acidiphila TaxID=1862145 RepID=A0A9J7ALW6_9PROT|nr:alpha/beta fold hydrolase [Nisaea acidiphila]UUX48464.1 thioesterase domain-containing protein [Nisaea acidiphila]